MDFWPVKPQSGCLSVALKACQSEQSDSIVPIRGFVPTAIFPHLVAGGLMKKAYIESITQHRSTFECIQPD